MDLNTTDGYHGLRFTPPDLAGIAVLAGATWHPAADEPYVCLLAGRGEIQLNEEGNAWFFRWDYDSDAGPYLQEHEDLGYPVGSLAAVAAWLVNTAREYQDR
jgi:hypothetical protein